MHVSNNFLRYKSKLERIISLKYSLLNIFNLITYLPGNKTSYAFAYSLDQVSFQTVLLFGINLHLVSFHQDHYSLEFESILDHQLVIITLCKHKFLESNKPMERACHSCQCQVTLKCDSK